MEPEFIIGLTEHRTFGYIFQALLIKKQVSFYTVEKLVKMRDLELHGLNEEQASLVKLTDQYSDEMLVKKFSKEKDTRAFLQKVERDFFENHIAPYIDRYMTKIIRILMNGNVRLFNKQAKYSNLYEEDVITIPSSFAQCLFKFQKEISGTKYSLQLLDSHGKPFDLLNKEAILVASEPCAFVWQNRLYPFEKLNAKKINPFFQKKFIFIPSSVEEKYYKTFILQIIKENKVQASGFQIIEEDLPRKTILSVENDLKMEISVIPMFCYGEKEFLFNNKAPNSVKMEQTAKSFIFRKINRDFQWEDQQMKLLKRWGLYENNGYFYVKSNKEGIGNEYKQITLAAASKTEIILAPHLGHEYKLITWIQAHYKEFLQSGFIVRQSIEKPYFIEKPSLDLTINQKDDWFDLYATVTFGDYQMPFIKLKNYILNGTREFQLPNGQIAIIPDEWFEQYRDVLPFGEKDGDHILFNKHYYSLLQEKLKGIDTEMFRKLDRQTAIQEEKLPEKLEATLRSYQGEGFNWMIHLYKNDFGGCLADDMGLGKTIQTLAVLLKVKELNTEHQASLIVMPASLIHNWHNEIKKFTPSLNVYTHTGNQRKKNGEFIEIINDCDIILSTYGTVRNDIDTLKDIFFRYVILDESQNIKNTESKTYKTIMQLDSAYRLTLTGTPIENSLSDLWAQINFLNDGLLGNLNFFRREFITPIEKKGNLEMQSKLQILIRPFILRRTKSQVAKDLPPVTEQLRYCKMSEEQQKIYEREKSAIRNVILENIENNTISKSAFIILQGLTKLRQLANHPSLLDEDEEAESGKFAVIIQNLENIVAENHKVLIFSSFVKHLELVREQIVSREWKYSLLTGKTQKREEEIRKFQEDPENRVFLISLKAGGVGLNLTAADYVFIIDPWWNPAAEMQAINRAHRIGQDKKVFVYRFITEDSIEEKIQSLQERKSSLADKFIQSNNPFKTITKEELITLFD